MKNYFLSLWFGVCAVLTVLAGCGGEPQDEFYVPGQYDAEPQLPLPEDSDLGVATQAFSAPASYGFQKNTTFNACVSGTRCLVARDKIMRPKCQIDTTYAAGFTLCPLVAEEVNTTCSLFNSFGWDCALTTGSSNEPIAQGTCPGNGFGCTTVGNISGTTFTQSGLVYQQFNTCIIQISKARLESDANYNASDFNRKKALIKNLIRHELGHCAGLPHNSTGVMSTAAHEPTANFTSAELLMLSNYVP